MDDELAFNMLDRIYAESCKTPVAGSGTPSPSSDSSSRPAPSGQPTGSSGDAAGQTERERFGSLVETLRQRLPEVYEASKKYYVSWCIRNAVVCRRFDRASALVKAMAGDDGGDMEIFHQVLDQLAYHGQLAILCEATRVAWPRVREVWDVMPWAVDEFASRAAQYVIFDHLARNPLLTADEPGLVQRIEQFVPLKQEYFRRHLDILTGRLDPAWTMDDFRFEARTSKKRRDEDEDDAADNATPRGAAENLHDLSFAFVRYLSGVEGVPFTRADLAREHIQRYIMDRINGELEPRPSMLDQMMHPRRHRRPPAPKPPKHVLCPDEHTLDRYLAERLHFMSPQYYDAAALFEAVPAWLRFLESKCLIDPERHQNTRNAFRPLAATIAKLWADYHQDPALLSGLSATWGVPTETSGS